MKIYVLLGLIGLTSLAYGDHGYRGNWFNRGGGKGYDFGLRGYGWNRGSGFGGRGYNLYRGYGYNGEGFDDWYAPRYCKGKWCGGYRGGYTGAFRPYTGGVGSYLPGGYSRGYTYRRGYYDDDEDDGYYVGGYAPVFGRYNYRGFGRFGYFPQRAYFPKKW